MVTPPLVFSVPLENSPQMMELVKPAPSPNTLPLLDHANVILVVLALKLSMEPLVNCVSQVLLQAIMDFVKIVLLLLSLQLRVQQLVPTVDVVKKQRVMEPLVYCVPLVRLQLRMELVNSAPTELTHLTLELVVVSLV